MRAILMTVPEAPVHKNHCTAFGKGYIRLARQIVSVQAKPEAKTVEKGADLLFGRRIGRAHTAHDIASLFRRKRIQRAIPS
ncbi:MAG: hypothetical protein A2X96_12440 [Syntrophobacterales bacterium GWC2_56_13]|nr:MAG: hypothetical protein A2X96_12440 [Syntrophobacterales bacterium GWC2_56_13]